MELLSRLAQQPLISPAGFRLCLSADEAGIDFPSEAEAKVFFRISSASDRFRFRSLPIETRPSTFRRERQT